MAPAKAKVVIKKAASPAKAKVLKKKVVKGRPSVGVKAAKHSAARVPKKTAKVSVAKKA